MNKEDFIAYQLNSAEECFYVWQILNKWDYNAIQLIGNRVETDAPYNVVSQIKAMYRKEQTEKEQEHYIVESKELAQSIVHILQDWGHSAHIGLDPFEVVTSAGTSYWLARNQAQETLKEPVVVTGYLFAAAYKLNNELDSVETSPAFKTREEASSWLGEFVCYNQVTWAKLLQIEVAK